MIWRINGLLEVALEQSVVISTSSPTLGSGASSPTTASVSIEVLVPPYLRERLTGEVGREVSVYTLMYLEGQAQGATMWPRVMGFGTAQERAFFELLRTVKGLGPRRALRAMAEEPAQIALWIGEQDVRALQTLPEIGKKMAEAMVVELREKVQPFIIGASIEPKTGGLPAGGGVVPSSRVTTTPGAADAMEALIALGESRSEAERLVARVLELRPGIDQTDEIVAAALGGR